MTVFVVCGAICLVGWGARGIAVAAGLSAAAIHPLIGLALGASVVAVRRAKQLSAGRRVEDATHAGSILGIELVAQGLSSGVPFDASVRAAGVHLSPPIAAQLQAEARRLRHAPAAHPTPEPPSPIEEAFHAVGVSEQDGVPAAPRLVAIADRLRLDRETARDEQLQRLPVAMLFPLAFLILPGFLLTAVAPPVIGGISRLGL